MIFQEKFPQSQNQDDLSGEPNGQEEVLASQSKEAILEAFRGNADTMLQMEAPVREIVKQLAPEIIRGDFHTILCDDASGRVPAFFMRKFLKRVSEAYGHKAPQTIFIAGPGVKDGPADKKQLAQKERLVLEHLKEKLAGIQSSPNGKVMLLTETISKGESVGFFARILREAQIPFEVVTIGFGKPRGFFDRRPEVKSPKEMARHKENLEEKFGGRITYGMLGKSFFDGDRNMNGVVKKGEDLFSKRYTEGHFPQYVALSRAFAGIVAEEVAAEFLKEHPVGDKFREAV